MPICNAPNHVPSLPLRSAADDARYFSREQSGLRPVRAVDDHASGLLPTLPAPVRGDEEAEVPLGSFFVEDLEIGSCLGSFQLIEKLGRGAMGCVFRGRHLVTGEDVAVKVLHKNLAGVEEHERRFQIESELPLRIDCDAVARPRGMYRTEDGTLFVVMDLLPGHDLSQLLETGPLNLATALSIGRKLSDILARVHEAGIVRRDVKPANMMVSRPGGHLKVTLVDFGIALDTIGPEAESAREHAVLGSPPYLSPEQASGTKTDHRSDIYAVGAVLYEAITGEFLFEGSTVYELILATTLKEAPSVSSLRWIPKSIRAELDTLIARCLDKDPSVRPQSAQELALALRRIESALHCSPGAANDCSTINTFLSSSTVDEYIAPAAGARRSPTAAPRAR